MTLPTSVTIVAIAVAAPGKEHALRALQERLVAEVASEPGCLRYELNQSKDDPRTLVFVETWASEEAFRTHSKSPAVQRFQASEAPHYIESFTLHRMSLVASAPTR